MISQRAVDLIVSCEVSSRAYYEKNYRHPEWPGGASGVTVGIGYDIGYASVAKLRKDWDGKLPDATISIMERCVGVTGDAARQLLPSVRAKIDVPWDAAMQVFLENDVPEWTDSVLKSISHASILSPDSLGALVSLAYNRGASFDRQGDRYSEMRDIKMHINSDRLAKVPGDFRSMKRLWPDMRGLRERREAEAKLFADGLVAFGNTQSIVHVAPESPAPVLPPAPAGNVEHGSAAGAAVVTGAAVKDAVDAGFTSWEITALVIGGIVVSLLVWLAVRAYRKSQPTLARAKDAPAPTEA